LSALFDFGEYTKLGTVTFAILVALVKVVSDAIDIVRARKRLLEAEKQAYRQSPEDLVERTDQLKTSHDDLEKRARALDALIQSSRRSLQVGRLFDLYSKQIEKYQTETQARAGWSFIFAIVAMIAGLGFVVGGGVHILTNPGWEHVAAATAISGIGGAVGAFITKTFLDVHRLSLSQLNHYFRQPVVNAHVLTAQRLAEQMTDPAARQIAYQQILSQVAGLIREEASPGQVWTAPAVSPADAPSVPTKSVNESGAA